MDMGSSSFDGHASFSEARGAGGECGIVSSLGSKEAACLNLGFLLAIPSGRPESWVAGSKEEERRGFFGFQLEIEAISALVILPMGLDGGGAICSADLDGGSVGAAGVGSPRHSQSWKVGVDGIGVDG